MDLIKKIEQETARFLNEPVVLIGSSKAYKRVLEKIQIYTECSETISIYGEIGTGKTELAKVIHCLGHRKKFPFIHFDCSLLGESLAEAELFGHKKGAFTGAIENRIGLLEAANQGTFFIDEVGNLPLNLQMKLLRVTQERKIRRVGINKDFQIDISFLTATHKNLKKGIEEGWFREDLFSRINVLTIEIPSLRERKGDILELMDYKLFQLNKKYNKKKTLFKGVEDYLLAYPWPENIRELNNAITKAFFDSKDIINIESFPEEIKDSLKKDICNHETALAPNQKTRFLFKQLIEGKRSFKIDVHRAFLNRDLNRLEVKELIKIGLQSNGRKYMSLSKKFNYDYDKFMGFLRHHNLKPNKMEL